MWCSILDQTIVKLFGYVCWFSRNIEHNSMQIIWILDRDWVKDWTAIGPQGQLRSGLFSESKCRTVLLEWVVSMWSMSLHMHIPYFLILHKKESCTKRIRAVAEQQSSPELCLANKTKIHLKQKMNSKLLEYKDVLYFDLQPHPMACTLESEWKQTLQGYYIWKVNTFWWLTDVI